MNIHKFAFSMTLTAGLAATLVPGIADARSTKLVEPPQMTTSCDLPADKMKEAIIMGGASRGWFPVSQTDEDVELKYVKGENKHVLLVHIAFTKNTYAVRYKDSTNLDYKVKKNGIRELHPRPITWMNNLSNDIRIRTDIFCAM